MSAASAPTEPASVATVLYVPKSGVGSWPAAACGSIACSSEVNGPDSTTSVEIVPVSAAMISAGSAPVTAKSVPATAIARRRARYQRRRPRRSPWRASAREARAFPARIAARIAPTAASE